VAIFIVSPVIDHLEVNNFRSKTMNLESKKEGSRTVFKTKCCVCENDVWRRKRDIEEFKRHFCSSNCKGASQRTGQYVNCCFCDEPVWRPQKELKKEKRYFCGKSCQAKYFNQFQLGDSHPNWTGGLSSYRDRAIRHYGKKCMNEVCEIQLNKIIIPELLLDVDHIDSDRSNNDLNNLQVLCVWCHTKKTRKLDGGEIVVSVADK
jgi:hypothetical protein